MSDELSKDENDKNNVQNNDKLAIINIDNLFPNINQIKLPDSRPIIYQSFPKIFNSHAIMTAITMFSKTLQNIDYIKMSNIITDSLVEFTKSIPPMLIDISINDVLSPLTKWLYDLNIKLISQNLINISEEISERLERYKEINILYLNTMYDCKWFPYVGDNENNKLMSDILEILSTSRGISKRRENRIDKVILNYYTKSEIMKIKRRWRNCNLPPHKRKALCQTIDAYLRKEYALVIPFLATMWEGIIKSKINIYSKNYKGEFINLVDENGFEKVYSDFYNKMIIGTCYGEEDIVEGVPNRHGIAHSWYLKYPSKKTALNAIMLTDFLIKLQPNNNSVSL